ncbi:MAG: hypothetical protein ACLSUT_08260 [Christensenellales bacterium]
MKEVKTLKLKYGEYYSLKITDSSKNVINNVEITGSQITSEQEVFSSPTYRKESDDRARVAELMKGEARLSELKDKKSLGLLNNDEEGELKDLEDEFFAWTYEKISDIDKFKNLVSLFTPDNETPYRETEVLKHDLKCELQIVEKSRVKKRVEVPIIVRERVKILGIEMWWYKDKQIGTRTEWRDTDEWTENYRWADEFTIPKIKEETLTFAKYNIDLNQRLLNTALLRNNSKDKRFEVLNWRYKLTGGAIKIQKLQKEVVTDEESTELRGKNSYSYPESTLIEADARVGDKLLIKDIGEHILSNYKDGRETMELNWQGDPTVTLGDNIVLEDKFGIEKKFMVTGNEFILDNSGKFYMRTEGISVL